MRRNRRRMRPTRRPGSRRIGRASSRSQTDAMGWVTVSVALPAGVYRAMLRRRTGSARRSPLSRRSTSSTRRRRTSPCEIANHFAAPQWSVEPGETFVALWGTGYDTGRAYVEFECRGKVLRAWWTDPARTQEVISEEVTEVHAGRVHAPRDLRPREPGLHQRADRGRALDEQATDHLVGALPVAAGAGAEGDLDRGHHGGRRDARRSPRWWRPCTMRRSISICEHDWLHSFTGFLPGEQPAEQPVRECCRSRSSTLYSYVVYGLPVGVSHLPPFPRRASCTCTLPTGAARAPRSSRGGDDSRSTPAPSDGDKGIAGRTAGRSRAERGPGPGLGPHESRRDRVLLPAPAVGFARRGPDGVHDARGPDAVEVPGLRPRQADAERLS